MAIGELIRRSSVLSSTGLNGIDWTYLAAGGPDGCVRVNTSLPLDTLGGSLEKTIPLLPEGSSPCFDLPNCYDTLADSLDEREILLIPERYASHDVGGLFPKVDDSVLAKGLHPRLRFALERRGRELVTGDANTVNCAESGPVQCLCEHFPISLVLITCATSVNLTATDFTARRAFRD